MRITQQQQCQPIPSQIVIDDDDDNFKKELESKAIQKIAKKTNKEINKVKN
jgi:hypothetical protein